MTDKTQPEAGSTHIIRYALELGLLWVDGSGRDKVREALAALDALEAKLASIGAGGVQALSAAPASPWSRALEIRIAQGWKLKGDRIPVLYTDTINGEGVGRDDLWLCTTKALAASPTPPAEQQAAPKAAPSDPDDHRLLAITTVYEQGVGKGRQAHSSGKEIANPYGTGYRCDLAWQYGYKEGKKQQAATKAAPGEQQNCGRCCGSGEDPAGYYDQSRGDAGATFDGPCRECNGTGAAPQQGAQEPYPIDADPQGIRAVVADAITGALAFGAQGSNPPPEGHWLTPFWEMAREEAMRIRPASVSRDTLYLLRRLLSNQHTLTSAEFREELTKIVGEATQAADSVLEDAARWQELREQHESDEALCCVFAPNDMRECLVPVGSLPGELDAFMDAERAARKQGANHD